MKHHMKPCYVYSNQEQWNIKRISTGRVFANHTYHNPEIWHARRTSVRGAAWGGCKRRGTPLCWPLVQTCPLQFQVNVILLRSCETIRQTVLQVILGTNCTLHQVYKQFRPIIWLRWPHTPAHWVLISQEAKPNLLPTWILSQDTRYYRSQLMQCLLESSNKADRLGLVKETNKLWNTPVDHFTRRLVEALP